MYITSVVSIYDQVPQQTGKSMTADQWTCFFNRLIASGAHGRHLKKLLWRELDNFAGNRIPKTSNGVLKS